MLQTEIDNFIPADYLTSEGLREIKFGERVRIAAGLLHRATSPPTAARSRSPRTSRCSSPTTTATRGSRAASGRRLVITGDNVLVKDGYGNGGTPGTTYRYVGANGRLDLGGAGLLRHAALGADRRASPAPSTSTSGSVTTLDLGLQDYTTPRSGRSSAARSAPSTSDSARTPTLDLSTQDYTDLGFWKPMLATQLVPQGFNIDRLRLDSRSAAWSITTSARTSGPGSATRP